MKRPSWFARRVPYVPQMEATECGVACLAMVLRYHGAEYALAELRAACNVGRDGVSAGQIFRAAGRYGLTPRALRVDPQMLAKQTLPAIVHWEFNHFVVVARMDRGGVTIVDPAVGEWLLSDAEFSEKFTGVALTFEEAGTFERRTLRSVSLRHVRDVVRGLRGGGLALLTAVLLLEVFALLAPAGQQVLVDHVLVPARASWVWILLATMAACVAVTLVTTGLRDYVLRRLNFAADVELASAFGERLLELPLSFFELRSPGDLMQRAEAQRNVRDALLRGMTAVFDALLLFGYAALMLVYSLHIGGVILLLSGLRAVIMASTRQSVARATASELAAQSSEAQVVVEALSAPELVRAFGAEELLSERYEERHIKRLNAEVAQRTLGERARELGSSADGLAHAAVLWLGGVEVLNDRMTLGVLTGLLMLQSLMRKPLLALTESITLLDRIRAVFARLDDVFSERALSVGTQSAPSLTGQITLEAVTFHHTGQSQPVCQDLTLHIAAGEKVALVGRSGQGKSTMLRLLAGLQTPTRGRVLLDGMDLTQIARADLARQVGVVLQEPFLLNDSVRANLALSVPDVPEPDLREAARIACIDERVANLPEGYDTPLGESGARLSGGERQRLALARALVRKPRLLLLDEATSSLDLVTERRVHENLRALGCTRIVIAHRLETVRDADRILVIEGGKIVQQGSYEVLRGQPGLFAELVARATARAS